MTPRKGSTSCFECSPSTAIPRRIPSRWPSRPPVVFWSPACGRRAARSTPSIRWPPPGTGTDTQSPARSPTTWTRWCRRTSCAPTPQPTARFLLTPNWPRPSRSLPVPSRTPSGTEPRPATNRPPTCGSSSPATWPPSATGTGPVHDLTSRAPNSADQEWTLRPRTDRRLPNARTTTPAGIGAAQRRGHAGARAPGQARKDVVGRDAALWWHAFGPLTANGAM